MKHALFILLTCVWPIAASADVLQGTSADPRAELNTFYAKICKWTNGEAIPSQAVDITHDGIDDYIVTYDVSCRGQKNAFSGTLGMARQIWVSHQNQWVRILDVNARALLLETRGADTYVVLQHAGGYCMTADAAPCFLTLIFKNNALAWADADQQHPSMQARLRLEQEDQKND